MDPICLLIEAIAVENLQPLHRQSFDSAHWRLQGKTDAKKRHTPASLAAMSPLEAIAMHRGHLPPQIEAADGQHGLPFDT